MKADGLKNWIFEVNTDVGKIQYISLVNQTHKEGSKSNKWFTLNTLKKTHGHTGQKVVSS